MAREHLLKGLEADNLLAFLALLGFQRALERAKPEWWPRSRWRGLPLRPLMALAEDVSLDELLEEAGRGCRLLAGAYEFNGRSDPHYSALEAKDLITKDSQYPELRDSCDLYSALMSDGAVEDDGRVKVTPLCTMFGQGHQHFLERLEAVVQGNLPKEMRKKKAAEDLNSTAKLREALFQTWERRDFTQSFRWDPSEDRRYALRFKDPSTDKGATVHGANRLACLALPLLTAVPMRLRGDIRLMCLGSALGDEGEIKFRWPVSARSASLIAIKDLLAGSFNNERSVGSIAWYEAERISVGKFFNFTRASRVQ